MTVPKNACTTIKLALHHHEGEGLPKIHEMIHDTGNRLSGLSTDQIIEILISDNWFKFCFIRNPYSRLLSAYSSKIGNTQNKEYHWVQKDVKIKFNYPVHNGRRREIVSFRDFVKYLERAPTKVLVDGHFNSQTNILMPHLLKYDFIGRVENFNKDFNEVLKHLNATHETCNIASQITNPSSKISLAAVYDKELADRVFKLYESDFKKLGYERDSWMFDV